MTDKEPTRADLAALLTELLRAPRTAEVKAAIAKVQQQLKRTPK